MKFSTFVLSMALLSTAVAAQAAGGGGGGGSEAGDSTKVDPVVQLANAAITRKDWPAAQTVLKTALDNNAQNADYHNLYAYSLRKGSNPDMKTVFLHLMVDNPAKAREHLAALDKLCFFPCEEYSDLKKAIANYERSHAG